MVKRLKKQVNIRDRNVKPVSQYTVTAIEFLKSSNQPIYIYSVILPLNHLLDFKAICLYNMTWLSVVSFARGVELPCDSTVKLVNETLEASEHRPNRMLKETLSPKEQTKI